MSKRTFVPTRTLALAVALTTVGSMAAGVFATGASASTPKGPKTVITCAHLTAPAPQHKLHKNQVTGCSVPKATGGQGTYTYTGGSNSATIKWNKTGTTTLDNSVSPATQPDEKESQDCPAHTKEFVVVGSVTGGTGAAGTYIKAGETLTVEICVNAKGAAQNEPGNKLTIK
jgi:hypothetical protein